MWTASRPAPNIICWMSIQSVFQSSWSRINTVFRQNLIKLLWDWEGQWSERSCALWNGWKSVWNRQWRFFAGNKSIFRNFQLSILGNSLQTVEFGRPLAGTLINFLEFVLIIPLSFNKCNPPADFSTL